MSIAERLPDHPTAALGRPWPARRGCGSPAYWVNGRLWDWLLYDVLGMDTGRPADRDAALLLLRHGQDRAAADRDHLRDHVLRSYMSVERTRALLGGRREGVGNVMAAGLGVVTPFCSCSAVPAFIGFVAAGVPLGVTLSFLIASPLVNEIAIGLLLTPVRLAGHPALRRRRPGRSRSSPAGCSGRLGLERWVEPFVFETKLGGQVIDSTAGLTFDQRIQMGVEEVGTILRKIWPYLLVGIGLGAVIHGWAPEDFFTRTPAPATRSASWSPWPSGSRCTPTPPASCRWSRPCTTRACRWAPCSRS